MSRSLGQRLQDVSHEKQAFAFLIYLNQIWQDMFPPRGKVESWGRYEELRIHGGKQIFSALSSAVSSG